MENQEGNKLIAEFMGWSFSKTGKTARVGKGVKSSAYRLTDIHYHTSWDWLMPVVEKIENIKNHFVVITENYCKIDSLDNHYSEAIVDIQNFGTKIEATYQAVIAFIRYHNEHGK